MRTGAVTDYGFPVPFIVDGRGRYPTMHLGSLVAGTPHSAAARSAARLPGAHSSYDRAGTTHGENGIGT